MVIEKDKDPILTLAIHRNSAGAVEGVRAVCDCTWGSTGKSQIAALDQALGHLKDKHPEYYDEYYPDHLEFHVKEVS